MCDKTRSHVALQILDYLRSHPDAQDTLAGIAEWWLPEGNIKTQLKTVAEALAELVAKDLVIQRKSKDDQIHYRINQKKLPEIESLLEQRPM